MEVEPDKLRLYDLVSWLSLKGNALYHFPEEQRRYREADKLRLSVHAGDVGISVLGPRRSSFGLGIRFPVFLEYVSCPELMKALLKEGL